MLGAGFGVTYPPKASEAKPVINWDFLQSQSLTSFSRTSNATLFDSTGKLTYAANNLALYSEDFDQTEWKNNTTTANLIVTPNDALSPIGTQTADKVVTSSTSGAVRLRQNITPILKSTKIVFSVWVKSDSIGYFRVWVTDGISSIADTVTQVGTTWTRISCTGTMSGSATEFGLLVALTDSTGNSYATGTWYIWGAQAEAVTYQTTPSTYNPTTTAPYYGPRYPYAYNGTTWDAQGLLVEAAGTNLRAPSANYVTSLPGMTATSNNDAPDGTSAAYGFTEDTSTVERSTTSGYSTNSPVNLVQGQTVSFFVKRTAGSSTRYIAILATNVAAGGCFYDLSTVTATVNSPSDFSATITSAGNGFYRCSLTRVNATSQDTHLFVTSVNSPYSGSKSYAGDGVSKFVFWGFQLENGTFATSYIPNATGTTTRNADTSLAFSAISLPTGLSFSRASNAMQYDAAGRLTYAPHNLAKYGDTLETTGGSWTSIASGTANTITLNSITGPDGVANSASLITYNTAATGAGTYSVWRYNLSTTANGAYMFSVWLRAGTNTSVYIRLNDSNGNRANTLCNLTTAWQRFTVTGTTVASITALSVDVGADGNVGQTMATGTIYAWGAQLEAVTYETVARPYVANSTANAVYGPRYDYDPLTRLPKGLLIEEGRTNVLVNSQTFSGWLVFTSLPVGALTANAAVSPSGVVDAPKYVADTSSTNHLIAKPSISLNASTTYTLTAYIKAAGYNFGSLTVYSAAAATFASATYDLTTGVTTNSGSSTNITFVSATAVNAGNGWWRCSYVFTVGTTGNDFNVYIGSYPANTFSAGLPTQYAGNGTSGAYFWGAQLEAGSFPTSYIPTPGIASGIRSADISKSTSFGYAASGGTVVSEWFADKGSTNASTYPGAFLLGDATPGSSNGFALRSNDVVLASRNPNYNGATLGSAPAENSINRVAGAYNTSFHVFGSLNGAAVVSTATNVITPTITTLWLGQQNLAGTSNPDYLNGHIRKFAYYNVKLADAKLQQKSVVGATL